MLTPGRKFSAGSGYRYGFNGKELDKETTGTSTYDYGFRIYNPALGRFLSVDPLTRSYPMLTPYQFSSNNPILNIDVDGLEGETYLEYKMEDGKEVVLRRVYEVEINIAVTKNSKLVDGFFVGNKFQNLESFKTATQRQLDYEFNDPSLKLMDPENKVPVVFRFGISTFDIEQKGVEDFNQTVIKTQERIVTVPDEWKGISPNGTKSVILKNGKATASEDADDGSTSKEEGNTLGQIITIPSDVKDKSHTIAHEIAHYMISNNKERALSNMKNTAEGHAAPTFDETGKKLFGTKGAGGIFNYIMTLTTTSGDINPRTNTSTTGKERFSQDNLNAIRESAIDTGKKLVDK